MECMKVNNVRTQVRITNFDKLCVYLLNKVGHRYLVNTTFIS